MTMGYSEQFAVQQGVTLMGPHSQPPAHATTPPPRLMDQVHEVCRRRHLSPRTEEAYRFWIRQFIFFHGKRHPCR
jgi:hypothetical protein